MVYKKWRCKKYGVRTINNIIDLMCAVILHVHAGLPLKFGLLLQRRSCCMFAHNEQLLDYHYKTK